MRRILLLFLLFSVSLSANAQHHQKKNADHLAASGTAGLQSGPMIGYVDMFEALVWVQTKGFATVHIEYWEQDKPETRYKSDAVKAVKPAFTAKCIANKTQPGRIYNYEVYINKKKVELNYPTTFRTQTQWQWRTDPPPFSFVAGSCFFINEEAYDRPKPYGSNYQICSRIYEKKPDFMIWLGDNAYYREPDWFTQTGMVHRFTHTRSLPELQPLLASTAHYAIWDDHDYGPDNSDATWINKETAWQTFRQFWGNPTFGVDGRKGCTTMFSWNDADFFLLDNRYFRTPNNCKTCDRTAIGHEQMEWLIGSLSTSRAQFKFVAIGGQVLSTDNHSETAFYDFPQEREELLRRIEEEGIKGVIFLTGDRHFTELSSYQNKAGNRVYDLTSSSLTAGAFKDALSKTSNDNRVPGTVVPENNFCLLSMSGPFRARTLTITCYNAQGTEMWTKAIQPDYTWK